MIGEHNVAGHVANAEIFPRDSLTVMEGHRHTDRIICSNMTLFLWLVTIASVHSDFYRRKTSIRPEISV